MPDGSARSLPTPRNFTLAPDRSSLSDGLSRRCKAVGGVVLEYFDPDPYEFASKTHREFIGATPARVLRKRAAAEEAKLRADGADLEPALEFKNGRTVDPRGHNPPTYNVGVTHEPDEVNPDDDPTDAVDLPDSSITYAETLVGIQPRTIRKPNELPEDLPTWAQTGHVRAFLLTARLTDGQIKRLVRSRDLAARRVSEHAETLVSGWTLKNKRRKREVHLERAHVVLRKFLALADEIRGITRTDDDRFYARFETVRQLRKSERRTEMLEIYKALLNPDTVSLEFKRRQGIAEIYDDECRSRTQHITHNGVRHGWFLYDPERAADVKPVGQIEITKNKANPRGCNETPVPVCALMDMRAPDTTEREESP